MNNLTRAVATGVCAVAALSGCGANRAKINAVVVTAISGDVTNCKRLGWVAMHSGDESSITPLDQMRVQALQKGGNTVYITSYALSTTGTAYACDPPVKPDGRFTRPAF